MIVQPDFLDHWKTQMLCDLMGDQSAPLFLIRIWGHCQNRKTHRLPTANPSAIRAICKAEKHDAKKLYNALIETGFLRHDGEGVVAHDWAEVNASLIASWKNGRTGGRPPKKNPKETHGLPMANPDVTDKRREEKIRREKNNSPLSPKGEKRRESVSTADQEWSTALSRKLKDGVCEMLGQKLMSKTESASFLALEKKGVSKTQIESAVEFVIQNSGKEYFPVIHGSVSFKKKWDQIQTAKRKAKQNGYSTCTEDELKPIPSKPARGFAIAKKPRYENGKAISVNNRGETVHEFRLRVAPEHTEVWNRMEGNSVSDQ